ncbi:MAG: transporter substrate-binding domain-containing protein [Peptococcaceae bacterium]|nr:transporter substrate-binding domain-containing protein [Peptococcaceae bacterium]
MLLKKRIIIVAILLTCISLAVGISIYMLHGEYRNETWTIPEQKQYEQTIKVVSDLDYPPFSFLDANGNPAGHDVELIYAIGEKLQMNIDLELMGWDKAMDAIKTGEADVILSIAYSSSRLDTVDYSVPISNEEYTVFGRDMAEFSLTELNKSSIAMMSSDSTAQAIIQNYQLDNNVFRCLNYLEAFVLWSANKCDYVIAPYSIGTAILQQYDLIDIAPYDKNIYNNIYAIATSKGNEALLAQIDEAIYQLGKSGHLEEMQHYWFVEYLDGESIKTVVKENRAMLAIIVLLVICSYSALLLMYEAKRNNALKKRFDSERQINSLKLQLETVLRGNSGGFCVWEIDSDRQARYLYVSESLLGLLGYKMDEMYGKKHLELMEIFQIEDLDEADREKLPRLQDGEDYSLRYTVKCKDGTRKWIAEHGKMMLDEKGIRKYYSFYQDITTFVENQNLMKEIADSLQQERARYHDALLYDSICSYDFDVTEGKLVEPIMYENEDLIEMMGMSLPVAYDVFFDQWQRKYKPKVLYGKIENQYCDAYIDAFNRGKHHIEFEYYIPAVKRYERKIVFLSQNEQNGHIIACTILKDMTFIRQAEEDERLALLQLTEAAEQIAKGNLDLDIECNVDGQIKILADSFRKTVVELKKRTEYINNLAYMDILTNTQNKTAYTNEVDKLEYRLATEKVVKFGVVMFDVNYLKEVNDIQGHEAGDMLIKVISDCIKDAFAPSTVYRIGGDEFVVITYEDEIDKMFTRVNMLENRIADYNRVNKNNFLYGVSVAVGYTEYQPADDMSYIDVFNRADNLMYENKKVKKQNLQRRI